MDGAGDGLGGLGKSLPHCLLNIYSESMCFISCCTSVIQIGTCMCQVDHLNWDEIKWCWIYPAKMFESTFMKLLRAFSAGMIIMISIYDFMQFISNLCSANIEYLKWDMNRPLTEVYSASGAWQSEISHRYVLGLYELQRRITEAFPHVLLENCASGGGRFDPGMLYYSSQIWCSDNTDALTRMRIQYGTSLVYPARVIGSHISTVPNHITGNSSCLRTRGFIAMCGTFGFELDFCQSTQKDMNDFRKLCDTYRALAKTIRYGDIYRLWNPFKVPFAAWMYVSCDKSEAAVFAFSMNSDHWSNLVPRLTLAGLDCDTDYEVTEPMPNNLTQSTGNVMIIETEGKPIYPC